MFQYFLQWHIDMHCSLCTHVQLTSARAYRFIFHVSRLTYEEQSEDKTLTSASDHENISDGKI